MVYIYAIQHNVTKKIYVGKSKDIYRRYEQHLSALRSNSHSSIEMQNDFNTYGENYSLYVLEEVEGDKERVVFNGRSLSKGIIAEIYWIKRYNTINEGYNRQDYIGKRVIACDGRKIPFKEGIPKESI